MLSQTTRQCLRPHSLRQLAATRHFQTSTHRNKDDAFDPSKTRPEEESGKKKEDAEHGAAAGVNPVGGIENKTRDPQEGGRNGSVNENGKGQPHERTGPSGGGSAPKAGGGKSGGGGH